MAGVVLVTACGGDDLVLPDEGTPAAISIVRGNNQSATVGATLPDSLVVKVVDGEGRPVPSQSVSFEVVAGGGTVAPDDARTDANGLAGTSWTLGTGAGAQQVLAKPVGNGTPANVQVTFSANAGASNASDLTLVSGDDQTATAGTALPDSLVVRATDGSNNPVAGVTVTWTVTGGGAVSATTVATGADGRSAVRRTLGATAGAQLTIATSAGLDGSPVTFSATATVGSAGRLVIERQPSATASSGTPFVTQPRVQLADANDNPVSTSGISVQAQIVSGPAGASLTGASTATTGGGGLATFQSLGISGPAGSYTLNFVVPNRDDISGSPPSSAISLTAGSASRLVFATQPSNLAAGGTITPAVTVRIEDALGNPVTSATNQVTVAFGANPGGATLGGTRTVAAVAGTATFATLTVDRPGNGYTLQASATGLSGATSSQFSVSTGSAANIAANSATTLTGTAGNAVTPVPSVKVTDGAGNGVAGVGVTFAVTAGGGSVSGETQTTDASGVATVGSWVLGATAGSGNNKLTATSAGLSGSPVTFTASATAGSAGKLRFVTQPAAIGQSGVALNPQPVLQLVDANNNDVAQGGVSVTASVASGPGGDVGGAAQVNTNSQGRATFASLSIVGPSGTYTLSFGGGTVTGVTSGDIVIGSGAATRVDVVTQPSPSVQSGVDFPQQPVVRLEDDSGNPVGTSGVTVTVTTQSCGGKSLGGTPSAATNSSGEATFTNLRLTGTVGNCTLLFSAAGLTSVTSGVIAVGPGPVSASNSTISSSSGSITAGGSGSTITVTARDGSNNLVSGAAVSFVAASGGGSFTPGTGTTNASGVATTTYTNNAAGPKSIGATAGGVTLDDEAAVNVTPAAASTTTSTLAASATTITAGESTTLTLTLRDQFSNPIGSATVNFTTSSTGTFGAGPHTTNTSGVETTTYTATTPGTHDLDATAGGITESVQVTVTAAAPSASNSTISVVPSTITAGGAGATVTVTARDASNNPVSGVSVSFTATSGGGSFAPGSANTNASGVATTTYTNTAAGAKTIGASAGGVTLDDEAALTVNPGAADATQSTLVADPASVTAGSASTLTFTMQDQFGNPISGQSVTFSSDGTGTFGANPVSTTLGVASTTFTPSSTGTHNLDATVGAFVESAQLTVGAGAVSGASSTVELAPAAITAGGSGTTVTVTARDAGNNTVSGASVTLSVTGAGNVVGPANPGSTNGTGVATFTVTSTGAGIKTVSADIGGVAVTQAPQLTVGAGAADASQSSLVANPAATTAGTPSAVTLTLLDAFGNPISGQSVTFSSDAAGTFGANPVSTDELGVASTTFTPSAAVTHNVDATIGAFTEGAQLIVSAAGPDAAQSTVTAVSSVGVDVASIVTVTVHDQFTNPVPGITVTLAEMGGGGAVVQPVAATDAAGIATGSFSASTSGPYAIQADAGGVIVAQTAPIVVE